MKSLVLLLASSLLAAAAIGCSGASEGAPTSSAEEDLSARKVAFADFAKDVVDAVDLVTAADGCSFTATASKSSVALETTEGATSVAFTASAHDKITVSEKDEGDGSFVRTYTIAGKGKITLLRADDAFNSVEMSSASGASATCEVDF